MTIDPGGYVLPSENGFRTVMAIGVGAALLAFALASFIPRPCAAALAAVPAPAAETSAGPRPDADAPRLTAADPRPSGPAQGGSLPWRVLRSQ
jgi:hypothetical protein